MSNITAAQVKELRERSGAGMMECKKALVETDGDLTAAIELMRKSGQAKAAKKSGRIAAEGTIAIKASADNKSAIMTEVNTETDFAARDESFTEFVEKVIASGLENKVKSLGALLALPNIAKENEELIAKIGENIKIRRLAFLESAGIVGTYCHGGKIGVLVELSVDDLQLGKDIAMHIAASKPEVVAPEDLSKEIIDKEKEIFIAQAEQSGKPHEIIEKMVSGQIKKFLNQASLIGQSFVKDPSITVGNLLKQKNASVKSFVRFEVGAGIEKKEEDFASEVMAQVEGSK